MYTQLTLHDALQKFNIAWTQHRPSVMYCLKALRLLGTAVTREHYSTILLHIATMYFTPAVQFICMAI